jgi:hypothetical protein
MPASAEIEAAVNGANGAGITYRAETAPEYDETIWDFTLTEKNGEPDWLVITPRVYGTIDASDEFIPADGFIPFWKKIYGGTWADASENNCEGCSYESANVPVEPTAL